MKRSDLSWSVVSTGQRLHVVGVIADGGDHRMHIMGTVHTGTRRAAIRGGGEEQSQVEGSDYRWTAAIAGGGEGSHVQGSDFRWWGAIAAGEERPPT